MTAKQGGAYLLHRRAWKESSWLADFFVRDEGRLRLLVRGGRRQRGRNVSAWMQPFMPLRIQWQGRGSLPGLTGVEVAGQGLPLSGKPLLSGFYMNELLLRLLPEGENCDELFSLYHWSLQALPAADDRQLNVLLRRFELALLAVTGHGLDLERPPATRGWWRHDLREGWLPAPVGHPEAIDARWLSQMGSGRALTPEQARALKPVLRSMLEQLRPGVGEQSRALLQAWLKLEQTRKK